MVAPVTCHRGAGGAGAGEPGGGARRGRGAPSAGPASAGSGCKLRTWARDYYDALRPQALGGSYVNFLQGDEAQGELEASYGDNWDRLVEIKRRYDPDNLFRHNRNIAP